MTDTTKPDHATGWGESLPLPLTPESGAGPGDVAQARKAVRRAAGDQASVDAASPEVGGPGGPEPTRYNDWERKGRCSDF